MISSSYRRWGIQIDVKKCKSYFIKHLLEENSCLFCLFAKMCRLSICQPSLLLLGSFQFLGFTIAKHGVKQIYKHDKSATSPYHEVFIHVTFKEYILHNAIVHLCF